LELPSGDDKATKRTWLHNIIGDYLHKFVLDGCEIEGITDQVEGLKTTKMQITGMQQELQILLEQSQICILKCS